jgi:caa(3)-type oxidase subunit IV
MATHAQHAEPAEHAAHAEHGEHPNYVKVWAILLVLLLISFAGPYLGIRWVTLLTAFGIAVVKAYMVAKNFMHVNIQPRFVAYILGTVLVFMLLLYAGSAPDVMKAQGNNWAKQPVAAPAAPAHHGAH